MFLLVLMAILGAVLGVVIKPGLLAVPLAVAVAEGIRGLIGMAAPFAIDNSQALLPFQLALQVVESPMSGYLPLLGVSAGAALIAAVLSMLTEARPVPEVTLAEATALRRRVRRGKYVRAPDMIEDRPAQKAAEERQRSLLGL
jgi:hypothetical protein